MQMKRKEENSLPPLPAFPVISITQEEHRIVGRAQGTSTVVVDTAISVEDLSREETHEIGISIVKDLLEQLNTSDAIRVNVTAFTGDTFKMYYNPKLGVLEPIPEQQLPRSGSIKARAAAASHGKLGSLSKPVRTALLIGIGLLLITLLALGYRLLFGGNKEDKALPEPAQLPISAPAGWDTYADYVVDATAAPITVGEDIIYAQDSEVIRINGQTGQEIDRVSAPFTVKDIYLTYGIGQDIIAVSGSSKEAAIGKIGGELTQIEPPTDHANLDWVSGVPIFQSTGYAYVPDATGNLTKLVQPADSVPVVIHDKKAWMVSKAEPKAWLIDSDKAELPEAVGIPEIAGYIYQGPLTGVRDTAVVRWAKEGQLSDAQLELFKLGADNTLENPRSIVGRASTTNVTVDAQRNKILTQGLFVDVETNQAMKVSTAAKYGAGYAWTSGVEASRISVDSEVVNWKLPAGSSSSAIPSTLDSEGRAAVLYKPSNTDLPSRIYMLKVKEE